MKITKSLLMSLLILAMLAACGPAPTAVPTATPEPTPAAPDAPARLDDAQLKELEAYITQTLEWSGVPGLSIAVVQNGEAIFNRGFGVRDLNSREPVTPQTLMLTASATKPLTTLMMATVVDDGRMTWDTPVRTVLPTFSVGDPALTGKLAMRHLVCACSGMPSVDSPLFLSNMQTAEDLIRSLNVIKPVSELGEQYNYSNQMVAAGGYIAARAAAVPGEPLGPQYISAMQARVLDPIGMKGSTFSVEAAQASGNYALPHGMDLQGIYRPMDLSAEKFVLSVLPAGGLWSNTDDMSRVLITELNQGLAPDGKRVVSAENLAYTWEPQVAVEEGTRSYGLGWFIESYHGMRLIHHSGNSMGFSSDLAFLPEAGLGVVILTNAEGAGIVVDAIRYRLFEIAFGLPSRYESVFRNELASQREQITYFAKSFLLELDTQSIAPYVGTFHNPALGEITLSIKDGSLILESGGITSELRQISNLGGLVFAFHDAPWAILGNWVFLFEQDAQGNPVIKVHETNVSEPYVFTKSGQSN